MRFVKQSATLLQCTKDPCKLIESAGRTCYKSECKITDSSASKFVKMIMKRRHYSVIEHAVATFRIVTDRAVAQEITRHRIASYSAESTRYVTYGQGQGGQELAFVKPSGMDPSQEGFWEAGCRAAQKAYAIMLEDGCKAEQARAVLPLCTKSELVMTANFREWLHFLKLRCNTAAHPEMQEIALIIGRMLASVCPEVFGEFATLRNKESNSGKND